jgi:hypothetical protein
VQDLARFAMWQFRVLAGTDQSILARETLQEMQAVQWPEPKWGLGFAIWNISGKELVGHQGGCSGSGFKAQIILSPAEKLAAVVMVNATDAPQFTLALAACNVFSAVLGATTDEEDDPKYGKWDKYRGYYTADKAWAEAEVLEWDGALCVMWLPAYQALGSLVQLRHVDGDVFRQVRNDGTLGKHYVFGANAAGHIVSMKFNNNQLQKTAR